MALPREVSLGVGLATAALVWGIYQYGLPTACDIRAAGKNDPDIHAAERAAAWQSAAVVAGVSLIAKDPTVFIVGGAMIVGLSVWTKHSNAVDPHSGSSVIPSSRAIMDKASLDTGYSPA